MCMPLHVVYARYLIHFYIVWTPNSMFYSHSYSPSSWPVIKSLPLLWEPNKAYGAESTSENSFERHPTHCQH